MLGYGVSLALLFEFLRRRKQKFQDPSNHWVIDYIRDELFPVDEKMLSPEDRWERILRRRIRRENDLFGNDDYLRVYGIDSLVTFYQERKRVPEAKAWQELALKLLENSFPTNHPKVVDGYRKMAVLQFALADFSGAESSLRRIISEQADCDIRDLKALITALAAQERWKDVKPLAQRLRRSLQTLHGPYSLELENWLDEELTLAKSGGEERYHAETKEHLDQVRAINIAVSALGSDNPYLARDIERLSGILRAQGDSVPADALLNQAAMLRLIGRVRGTDYPGIERDLEKVAAWYRERGDYADGTIAFHLEKRAERIRSKRKSKKF